MNFCRIAQPVLVAGPPGKNLYSLGRAPTIASKRRETCKPLSV
jgi:hypothetical protein